LGHPTGRLLGSRDAYDVDLEAVFKEAAKLGVLMEVNSQPERLDLSDQECRHAKELGVTLAINSDSHSPDQLAYMRLGVATARRGWLEKADVVNTRSLAAFRQWLGGRR
jgi:DNA polymerase (family X)